MPAPNRGTGSLPGWVAPIAVRQGQNIVRSDNGKAIRMLGATAGDLTLDAVGAPAMNDPTWIQEVAAANGNHVRINMRWGGIEPNRPTGGDPATGTWISRDYTTSGYLALLDSALTTCDSLGIYAIVGFAGTNMGLHFTGTNEGQVPSWMFDSTKWAIGTLGGGESLNGHYFAPLPHDRSTYGGDYPGNSTGESDAKMAYFQSIGNSPIAGGKVANSTTTWGGDWSISKLYAWDAFLQVMKVACQHPSCIGYRFHNEPSPGGLGNSLNYNDNRLVANSFMRAQSEIFDQILALDPTRMIAISPQGGSNWHISADYSILWTSGHTGGGPIAQPDAYTFIDEIHWYPDGISDPLTDPTPYDNPVGAPIAGGATYAPTYINGSPQYLIQQMQAWGAANTARSMPMWFGEWAIGGDVGNYAQFFTDILTTIKTISPTPHLCYFNLGTSAHYGLTTALVPSGFSLNATTGPQLQTMYQKLGKTHSIRKLPNNGLLIQ